MECYGASDFLAVTKTMYLLEINMNNIALGARRVFQEKG